MEVLQTISTLPEGWEATSPPKPFDFCERQPAHSTGLSHLPTFRS